MNAHTSPRFQATQWNLRLGSNEYKQRRLTFGKHCNKMLQEIPTDYIRWGVLNLDTQWAEYFARELQTRDPELRKMGSVWSSRV